MSFMETLIRKVTEGVCLFVCLLFYFGFVVCFFFLSQSCDDTTFSFSDAETLNNACIDVSCATHNVKVFCCFKQLEYFMLRQSGYKMLLNWSDLYLSTGVDDLTDPYHQKP